MRGSLSIIFRLAIESFPTAQGSHRVRSKKPLVPAMATDWSITHSPTPRYLSIQPETSLLSPDTRSVLSLLAVSFIHPPQKQPWQNRIDSTRFVDSEHS